jgi:pSer/pThr/pTyr-binding forkhead associated (FHA) protein
MRLEVLVDKQEPLIFPLDKEQILIGSSENCDILLKTEGISRKHAVIYCHTDEFFIVDQGSTNGTFINEERLEPGKRFEFTSFFPVRLGESVLLTLLSDDEDIGKLKLSRFNNQDASQISDDDRTRVTKISLRSDRNKEATLKLETHRKKVTSKHRAKSEAKKPVKKKIKKEDKKFFVIILSAIVLFLGALYFQLNQEVVVTPPPPTLAKVGEVEKVAEAPVVENNNPQVEAEYIKTPEELKQIQMDLKCVSEVEKEVCSLFQLTEPYGVVQRGLDLHIFLDGNIASEYFDEFRQKHPDTDIGRTLVVYYVLKNPVQYPENLFNNRFHLHFLDADKNIIASAAYYPKSINLFLKVTDLALMRDVLIGGEQILEFTKDYLYFYPQDLKEKPL